MKRTIVTLTAAAVLVPLSAATALAHECIIANRSATGSASAAHSSRWFAVTLEEVFAEEFGVPAENVDDAVAEAVAAGIPEVIAIRTDKTIGEGSNGNHGDGKGLEHISESPLALTVFEIAIKYGGSP